MTFTELTKNPIITPTNELCDFLNIEKGVTIDFFKTIEKQLSDDAFEFNYANYGHYVVLCDGLLELFSSGIIEVRNYNFGIDIFLIVKLFSLQKIKLEPTSGNPNYKVVSFEND
jgi:hypothetical protein